MRKFPFLSVFIEQILRESHPSAYHPTNTKPIYTHPDVQLTSSYRYPLPASTATNIDGKPNLAVTVPAHMRRSSPLNALQPPYTLANASITHSDANPTSTPTAVNLASNQNVSPPSAGYGPLSKHWLWNANLFYPPNGVRMHDGGAGGFLPYSSNFSGIFATSKIKGPLLSPVTPVPMRSVSSTVDLSSQRSCCSDQNSDSDSLDVSDGQMTPSASALHLSPEKAATAGKKRNPYSIEELLKKPEKRIRLIEPIAFHPPILIHDRNQSKSPELHVDIDDDDDRHVCAEIDNNNKGSISIEVCDWTVISDICGFQICIPCKHSIALAQRYCPRD